MVVGERRTEGWNQTEANHDHTQMVNTQGAYF